MKKGFTILSILFGLLAIKVFAQTNLVPNLSFEEFTSCPIGISELNKAIPWFSPQAYCGAGTPDYFNNCNSGSAGVPNNGFGNEPARTGVAYAGFYTMNLPWTKGLEYIEVQLKDTLEMEKKYLVSFYVCLAEVMGYATNKIGAYFSDTAIVNSCDTLLPYTPQVQNTAANPLTSKNGWTLVSDTLIAEGGEKYMIIGNFNPLVQSDTIYVGGGTWGNTCCSYYYIDDVSVTLIDTTISINETDKINIKASVFPNPANEEVTIIFTNETAENTVFELYDILGNKVFDKKIESNIKQENLSISQIPQGVYLYRLRENDKLIATDKLIIIR